MTLNLRDPSIDAAVVRQALALAQHPEGGWYREMWRDRPEGGGRGAATAILFLLASGERSHWHRVDAAEIWLWHAGAALDLHLTGETLRLGPDLTAGERLQAIVPAEAWQAAEPAGPWSLVSCVVAPAFEFSGFRMAPPGWVPSP